MTRCILLVVFLIASSIMRTESARANHCLGQYHRAIDSIQSLKTKYASAGEKAKMSCADARELLRVLTLFGYMETDSCAHASSYHLYVEISEHIAEARKHARLLKRQMRGRC